MKILYKKAFKSMLQLGSILDPIRLHFGKVLGAKMGPSWLNMLLKIDSKSNLKNFNFLDGFKIDFWTPTWGLLGGQRRAHSCSFWESCLLLAHLGAKMTSRPPKMASRPLQDGLKAIFLMIFVAIFDWFLLIF